MHDSFTPLGGLVPMLLMQLGEVIYGGVGCGLYGMIGFVILTVFIIGLMVGRTPEYLGKKIDPFEMRMAVLVCLATPVAILIGSGIAALVPSVPASMHNPGPHGFSELLYAFSSAGDRRQPGDEEAHAGIGGNALDLQYDVRIPAHPHRAAYRRALLLPGAGAGADRRTSENVLGFSERKLI